MRSSCWVRRQVLAFVAHKSPSGPIRDYKIQQFCQLVTFQTFQPVFNILVLLCHLIAHLKSAATLVMSHNLELTGIDTTCLKGHMSLRSGIDLHTRRLARLAPSGFFFALHIRFALPLLHYQTYPQGWTDRYTEEAYALRDPIIAWGFSRIGTSRWSEIDIPDPFNILGQAKAFGMVYGFAVSVGQMSSRTIASACRADREFSDPEINDFATMISQLHAITEPPKSLTKAQIEALRCIAEGDRHAAAAARLNISESALKARLSSARTSLLARTTTEAIQRARDYRLL